MTTTKTPTIQETLDNGDANSGNDAMRKIQHGTMHSMLKVVVSGLTAASAVDITTAAVKAAATITGKTLASGEMLPPIAMVRTLRVTAVGTAATGPRTVVDAGGTAAAPPTATAYAGAAVGTAKISDDGKTLTFEGTVTGFVLEYFPMPPSGVAMTDVFPTPSVA